MRVKIRETGEIKTLSVIDPRTGIDWITDFVGNTGALMDGQFAYNEDENLYVADADTYDWWAKVAADEQALDERIEELKSIYGYEEVMLAVERVADVDLEDRAVVINRALDELEEQKKAPPVDE